MSPGCKWIVFILKALENRNYLKQVPSDFNRERFDGCDGPDVAYSIHIAGSHKMDKLGFFI